MTQTMAYNIEFKKEKYVFEGRLPRSHDATSGPLKPTKYLQTNEQALYRLS